MSVTNDPPPPTGSRDEEQNDMLESLTGLSIKGFHESTERNANTPSSTVASLPTPPALKTSHVLLASFGGKTWLAEGHSALPPNAPLMRDFDSFTEGTGHGSFDFPLIAGDEEPSRGPLFFHPPENFTSVIDMSNLPDADRQPSPTDTTEAVLAWIETTAEALSPRKRRRSVSQDSEHEERRTRAWSPSIESCLHPSKDQEEPLDDVLCREEPEPPG